MATIFTNLDPTVQVKLIEIAATRAPMGTGGSTKDYSTRFAETLKGLMEAIDAHQS